MSTCMELLQEGWTEDRFVCVGLDSDMSRIPSSTIVGPGPEKQILPFNTAIIEETSDIVLAYKINWAFYLAHGGSGLFTLKRTVAKIREANPKAVVILDCKAADIGNTSTQYAKAVFENIGADAATINPYLGMEAVMPFLRYEDKLTFVLCRTSNPGAGEFQDLMAGDLRLYQTVALNVSKHWNERGNCGLVVGATYPNELAQVRNLVGDIPILIPGLGAQGGDAKKTVEVGLNSQSNGIIINSSRGIIFASSGEDFAKVARDEALELHETINRYRKEVAQ